MSSRPLHSMYVIATAFALSCASAPQAGAPAGTNLSGSWTLNTKLSDVPAMAATEGRGGGGEGRGTGGGGRGGRGGGRGGGGRGGGTTPPNPETMAELRGYLGATERIVVTQGDGSIGLAFNDGTKIDVPTDKEKHSLSERHTVKAWWDEGLIIEHRFGDLEITEHYAHALASDRLIVTVKIGGRSGESHRVYERAVTEKPRAPF